jgi:hypothetical protein
MFRGGSRDSTGTPSSYFQSCSKGAACRPLSTANSQYSPGAELRKAASAFPVAVVRERAASPAGWAASSPLLQAFNNAVISAEDPSIDSAFFPQAKKYTRPWRNLLKASACTSGRRTKLPE